MPKYLTVALLLCASSLTIKADEYVTVSQREIPIVAGVDVVVVGGTSGGVAAAAAAARDGAKVFLVAPKAYLGEDICATERLSLPKSTELTTELAKTIFAEPAFVPQNFSYTGSIKSAKGHADTEPPSLLNNGFWASVASHSVQYDGNVTFTADLGAVKPVPAVHVFAFERKRDFQVKDVKVTASDDGTAWRDVGTILNAGSTNETVDLYLPVNQKVRYLKFEISKTAESKRILLGEIAIETDLQQAGMKTDGYRIPPRPMQARPMQVKRALDKELLDAGVQFVYRSHVTDVIRDSKGNARGVVIANRSGRQAVIAKTVIDATLNAAACRAAGAEFTETKPSALTFERIVIGSDPNQGEGFQVQPIFFPVAQREGVNGAIKYTFTATNYTDSFANLCRLEQFARDKTWNKKQLDSSENIFFIPPGAVKCADSITKPWPASVQADVNAFRVKGIGSLYVLSGYSDLARPLAEKLLNPPEYILIGQKIGKQAAADVKSIALSEKLAVNGSLRKSKITGEVKEILNGFRPFPEGLPTITCRQQSIPVLGNYDVIVVGGGTGGAPAGISAARAGAKTLVVEYQAELGGVATVGLIGRYHYGYRGGFCKEIDDGVIALGEEYGVPQEGMWNLQVKQEWYRKELGTAGADIWFDTMGCGTLVENGKIKGVIVATPYGYGIVLCNVVIDGTGNAEIAITAGAGYSFSNTKDSAMQGSGYSPFSLGARYTNTDYLLIDESDVMDILYSTLIARETHQEEYDLSSLINTRERRRVIGDYVISPLDFLVNRTFSDTICWSKSNFDTHGFAVHPAFFTVHPDPENKGVSARVPYRSLLPKGLDGIMVIGLGVSAHRDAIPIIRMEPDLQNQGYAAGFIAATASKENKPLRQIEIRKIQAHLVEKGVLPPQILKETDEFEVTADKLQTAIDNILVKPTGIAWLFMDEAASIPLLKKAYAQTSDQQKKVLYARILGVMGDDTGIDTLIAEIRNFKKWDTGVKWRQDMHLTFGSRISPLDGLIIAAGLSGNPKAINAITEKINLLTAKDEFSHHRAIALALECCGAGNKTAAEALGLHLAKPGISGNAVTDLYKSVDKESAEKVTDSISNSFREIELIRALYRCGDYEGTAQKLLLQYSNDLRGHFASQARQILAEKKR